MSRHLLAAFVILNSALPALADNQAEQAVSALRALCLAGERYELKIEGQGSLLLLKKGAGGAVRYSETNTRGVVDGLQGQDQLRELENIRECIEPHIPSILRMIRNEPEPPPRSDLNPGDILKVTLTTLTDDQDIALQVSRVEGATFVGQTGTSGNIWTAQGTLAAGTIHLDIVRHINGIQALATGRSCDAKATDSGTFFRGKCTSRGQSESLTVQIVKS